jgi:hypothetical protein
MTQSAPGRSRARFILQSRTGKSEGFAIARVLPAVTSDIRPGGKARDPEAQREHLARSDAEARAHRMLTREAIGRKLTASVVMTQAKFADHPSNSASANGEATNTALTFLKALRPEGPWVLTAIDPDTQAIETITVCTADEVDAFVRKYNGRRNLYYSVNPTRTPLNKKAKKTDIAAIEYALADLDPKDDETSEAAKARYLAQLKGAFEPKPSAVVDSGNGIQCLWRLQDRITLGSPIKAKDGLKIAPEDQAKIDDVEARVKAVMLRLGSKAGTQNIDRILRLPGTTNLPNATKRKQGRVACPTKLLWFDDLAHPLSAFPKDEAAKKQATGKKKTAGRRDEDELARAISDGAPKGDRSEMVWFVVNEMLRRGHRPEAIAQTLLDREAGISEHVYDQSNPRDYAERQVAQAIEKIDFKCNKNGKILSVPGNIRIGLLKIGVTVRHDQFADRTLLEGLPGFGPVLEDAAVNRLWLLFELQNDA